MVVMRSYRVPAHITEPFATRLGGVWRGRKSANSAWRAAQAHARANPGNAGRMLIVTRDGEPVPQPEERLQPSGASGQHRSPRIVLSLPVALLEALDRCAAEVGVTRSALIRLAIERAVRTDELSS